jgi:nucleotide-binding universal stress UspA family protein
MKAKRILLASHGTAGAQAAEKAALALAAPGATLHHLIVVPDFWKGMMGDDWLNNASTRAVYGRYVESELEKEVRATVRRLEGKAHRKRLRYRFELVLGKPADCLLACLARTRFDLVVTGTPRRKGEEGLRSRMLTEEVLRSLKAPLLVVPHPRG